MIRHLGSEARILEERRSDRAKLRQQCLLQVAERWALDSIGNEKFSKNRIPGDEGHTEEGLDRWMVNRDSNRAGIIANVRDAYDRSGFEGLAEDSNRVRMVPVQRKELARRVIGEAGGAKAFAFLLHQHESRKVGAQQNLGEVSERLSDPYHVGLRDDRRGRLGELVKLTNQRVTGGVDVAGHLFLDQDRPPVR